MGCERATRPCVFELVHTPVIRHLQAVRYEGNLYRPPSEADAYILQATLGCSWNACVYCDMYSEKTFQVRDLAAALEDIEEAGRRFGARVRKVFVADGDALVLPVDHWLALLAAIRRSFPQLRRVSCYAMARNVLEKSPDELLSLREAGLSRLYIGPESGDDITLKRIAKGSTFDEHVRAASWAHGAGMELSVIAMLGIGGVERSEEHARATARLVTEMDPEYFSALTTTVVAGTPLSTLERKKRFELPGVEQMFRELRIIVDEARPRAAVFRTNHASNYLPLSGVLPDDRERMVSTLDAALEGRIALRPEWSRGL